MIDRRPQTTLALGLIASLSCGGLRLASAAEPNPAPVAGSKAVVPPAPGRELAKAKYEQGVAAYRAEHYADAVRSFLEADAISPSAALSYNIARAYEKLSDDAQSLRWYRNYVRLAPQAKNATEVRGFVTALSATLSKKGIQQASVLSTPAGATVAIDGNPLGVTPLTVELPPGGHTALLTLRGYIDAPADFTLPQRDAIDVTVVLQGAPPSIVSAAPGAPGERRFGVIPYVTLGVAGALLGAAGIVELSRRSAQNSAPNEQVQVDFENDLNAIDSRRTGARVLLGAGSLLAVTGSALLLFNTRIARESRAMVAGVPGGAAFVLERSF